MRESLIRAEEDDHDHRERGHGLPWGREPQCDQGPRGPLHLPPPPQPDWAGNAGDIMMTVWWPLVQAPAPTLTQLTHHLVMSTKQQGHSHNSDRAEAHLEMRMSVCFIQTSSFYIPISTWFPCLGPGHIQSCHSLLNADKLISITGTLLSSLTRMLDFADIFRKQ